jgi:hypothetical protein
LEYREKHGYDELISKNMALSELSQYLDEEFNDLTENMASEMRE